MHPVFLTGWLTDLKYQMCAMYVCRPEVAASFGLLRVIATFLDYRAALGAGRVPISGEATEAAAAAAAALGAIDPPQPPQQQSGGAFVCPEWVSQLCVAVGVCLTAEVAGGLLKSAATQPY